MSGKLYICGTPIGNLEDASVRLLKTLRTADMIACEDTRHTIKLLNHFKIKNRLVSYHEHSNIQKEQYILAELLSGKTVALVSDAGMPTISDPGEKLIRSAIAAEVEIEVIPGPSACTAALAVSGLDTSSFVFLGFLPAKRSKRQSSLESIKKQPRTLVLYEAPHRLVETLEDIAAVMGEQQPVCIVREITKIHEEVKRGPASEMIIHFKGNPPRGEICLVIPVQAEIPGAVDMEKIIRETVELINNGIEKKEALKMKAREYKIKKSTIYKQFLEQISSD
ncbi:MAG: 16S rRNA (cytidine(1402)-2'-O)-methyltransferase [Syntrophomonadaceae bacterium]|nr:16S rRNA (cytidine(1402)-2'-O)-methyltransferase [Syntrophomonadaceae bacterium]